MTATDGRLREHVFDGISEMDNRLPNWWLWSLYITCIFSVFYWISYHTLGLGNNPGAAYLVEEAEGNARLMAELAKNPVTDELLLKLSREPATVEAGKQTFAVTCVTCHNPDASGNAIGPNLTDAWWLHGGRPMQIWATITEGRPNGMQSWSGLGRGKVQELVAFILSIKNTNRPGRDPQGKKEDG